MFKLKFYSPQAETNLIFRIMNYIQKLSHELPNDLKLSILGKYETYLCLVYSSKMEFSQYLSKNSSIN